MTSSKGMIVRLQVPLSSIQCVLLLPKNALLFPELPFYFQLVLFCFLEFLFCFPEVPFHFSKIPCCFLELSFVYQKCLIFIFYAHLFPRMLFFSSWWYLLFILLRAAKRDHICFALVLFLLVAIYSPTYDVAWCLCSHSSNKQALAPGHKN